ncbi:MAG TPA: hypothetical protein VFD78_02080 [Chitinophagaceae bacterium]|nr:hypothetical protein [Chitinophagaceae bacterium]
MTEQEKRIISLKRLKAEIKEDLTAIESVTKRLREWVKRHTTEDPGQEMCYAFAALLHHFYTGVESCLKRIIKVIDGSLPGGEEWHRELLQAASVPVETVRPSVIDQSLRFRLDEYRRFRHLFRNAYGHEIKWERLSILVKEAEEVFKEVKSALIAFLGFLDDLIGTLEG